MSLVTNNPNLLLETSVKSMEVFENLDCVLFKSSSLKIIKKQFMNNSDINLTIMHPFVYFTEVIKHDDKLIIKLVSKF